MTAPRTALLGMAALLLLAVPADVRAQEYSRFTGSFALLNTQPLGELSTGPGIGVRMAGAFAVDPLRIFRIHGEFRASIYDHESREVCFSSTVGCRIVLDLNTSYSTMYAGLGPQLVFPVGPTEIALDATAGWSGFIVSSSVEGVDENDEGFGDTTNYEDHTFAWSSGGELRIPVSRELSIALGGHYQHNGEVSYLREGGITENPDGTLSYNPQRTEANMVAITLGVTFRPMIQGSDF